MVLHRLESVLVWSGLTGLIGNLMVSEPVMHGQEQFMYPLSVNTIEVMVLYFTLPA